MSCLKQVSSFKPLFETDGSVFDLNSRSHYPPPIKYEKYLIFCTESHETVSGIYQFHLITGTMELLQKYPANVCLWAHGAFLFGSHRIVIFGTNGEPSLLLYDIKKNKFELIINVAKWYPAVFQPLLEIGSYPKIYKLEKNYSLIQSSNLLLVIKKKKIYEYDWDSDFIPHCYYKPNSDPHGLTMWFFGADGHVPTDYTLEENMRKEKIYGSKFEYERPLEFYHKAYNKITIPWRDYFDDIDEFCPMYQVVSPFNDLIFMLIVDTQWDIYYIDLNQQKKHKVSNVLPEELTSAWSNDIYVHESDKNELLFISLTAGLCYSLDPSSLLPDEWCTFYFKENYPKNLKLIQGFTRTRIEYNIPLVVEKLIALYFPLDILKLPKKL